MIDGASGQPAFRLQDSQDGEAGVTSRSGHSFAVGESVCAMARVRNEGTYPHRDIGEILVREGDLGYVHESWSFLDEVYYTVEFVRRAVVVIMRGREMARIGRPEAV
jgi:nitrogen fixation protein NifZ